MGTKAMSFDYDVVIVGSGFGGSVAALRSSEKGYRVAVVEKGKRYRPQDFARTSWDARKFLWRPALGCTGIMQMTLLRDVFVLHGAGVGGGSLVYANTLLEPGPEVFSDPRWVGGIDWRQVLAPHYATAKRMLGVTEAPRLYEADRLLHKVVSDMGRGDRFHKTDVAVFFGEPGKTVPDPYFGGEGPPRTGCIHCGACMVGCRYGAKNTLDQNYLYLAERRGAEVIPEHEVVDLRPLSEGGYELTMRRSTGWRHPTRVLRAERVVLAAGVLGTVRLLLSCKQRRRLPNLSPRLGDFVRTNSETLLGVRTRRRELDFSKGIAIAAGAYVDDRTHVEVVRYNEGSDAMGLLGTILTDGGGPWPRWLRWIATMLRHPLDAVRAMVPFGWAKKTAVLLVMQPVSNFLRLGLRRRWWSPWRWRLVSDRGTDSPVPNYFPLAHEIARRMAAQVDGVPESSIPEVLFNVSSTAHILGGCPIGVDPEDGVVDTQFRVFGHPGLMVVDGSVVPANLGVNPSLTITALAEYAMSLLPAKPAGQR